MGNLNLDFNKRFKKERRYIELISVLAVFSAAYYLESILLFSRSFLICFASASVLLAFLIICRTYHKRKIKDISYEDAPDSKKQELFDRYSRRIINWILLTFWFGFGIVLRIIVLGVNSKSNEIFEVLFSNIFILEILAALILINVLIVRWLVSIGSYEKDKLLKRELRIVLISSTIYWIIAVGIFYLFEEYVVLDITPFVTGVFVFWIVIYNFTRINKFTYEKKKHNKIVIATVLIVALLAGGYKFLSRDLWLTQPYINSIPYIYNGENKITYDDETGVYTITKADGDFKVLQLTDIHLGGSTLSYDKDMKALRAVYALLEATKPDFVIVTGDLVFPVGIFSFSFNNTAPVQQFAAFMRNTGIPWAFTYGNHDTESYAASSVNDLDTLYKSLSFKTSRTLLYPYVQPDIMGRNNQVIELRNSDGTLNNAFFLIDSNAYTGDGLNKYDYIHDDQVEWYKEQVLRLNEEAGHIVPSMIFFHIPLQQYKTAYELYEQGSDEVTWYFGSNDEEMIDKVCCSEYPSSIFDVAKELGSTTGFFCGHDHYNNASFEYQGIRLTYGMSIDYLAMPGIARDTKQRGGTLITIHDDGTTDIEQIPLDSIMNSSNSFYIPFIKDPIEGKLK
jgi:3',5'-cyclic AMP phosphodiesterase CpdA